MNFSPQGGSYRLGDMVRPRNTVPDGDYVGVIDPAKITADFSQKTQKAQIKVVAFIPQQGVEHTWWYNIHPDNLWALCQDLINTGLPPETELQLPQNQAEPWVPALQNFWGNKPLNLHLETKKEYQNTSIRGIAQVGPGGGLPAGGPNAAAPAPVAAQPAAQPVGNRNAFELPGSGGGGTTGYDFMRPHTGPGGQPSTAPVTGAPTTVPPAAAPSAADLFRSG